MSGETDNLFTRMATVEKDVAICMDRTGRHDDEIRALTRDVQRLSHDMTRLTGVVENGFREASSNHATQLSAINTLQATASHASTKTLEWSAVIKFSVGAVTVGGAFAGILRALGVV